MNKILLSLALLVASTSCRSQQYQKNIIDLQHFNFDVNTERFYSEAMKRENVRFSSEAQYVEKDTVTEYDLDWQGDRQKIFGVQYDVTKYADDDVVATFGAVQFHTLGSLTEDKGNLMLINAVTRDDDKKIAGLIAAITQQFGKPEQKETKGGYMTYQLFCWEDKDVMITLATKPDLDLSDPQAILSEKEKENIKDIESHKLPETILYMGRPAYKKKLKGQLHSGNWWKFDGAD